jgi:hypothetical protein
MDWTGYLNDQIKKTAEAADAKIAQAAEAAVHLSAQSLTDAQKAQARANIGAITLNQVYPVGSIYLSVSSANPGTLFGGTWVAWGTGRVPVGINTSDPDFWSLEQTGGSKYLQSHVHGNRWNPVFPRGTSGLATNDLGGDYIMVSDNMPWGDTGGGYTVDTLITTSAGAGDSQNLQPYITCYMWKRTA